MTLLSVTNAWTGPFTLERPSILQHRAGDGVFVSIFGQGATRDAAYLPPGNNAPIGNVPGHGIWIRASGPTGRAKLYLGPWQLLPWRGSKVRSAAFVGAPATPEPMAHWADPAQAGFYVARQGERLDEICLRELGAVDYVPLVLDANPGLSARSLTMSAGDRIDLSVETVTPTQKTLRLWGA
jgi:phage tail protein X